MNDSSSGNSEFSDFEIRPSPAHVKLQRRSSSAKGTASLTLAIVSLVLPAIAILGSMLRLSPVLPFLAPVAVLVGLIALIVGGLGIGSAKRSDNSAGLGTSLAGAIIGGVGFLASAIPTLLLVFAALEAKSRSDSTNNLKRIGMSFHNHHDTYGNLPVSGVEEESNQVGRNRRRRPLEVGFSWRVRLLPFWDRAESARLHELNENEDWKSPHNAKVLGNTPGFYRSPSYNEDERNTVYLGVVGEDPNDDFSGPRTALGRANPTRFATFTDGTSSTIIVVEADADFAVPWAKPADWEFHPGSPKRGLGGLRPGGFLALFADGSVRFIPSHIDETTLEHLFQCNDGNQVDLPSLQSDVKSR